MVNVICLRDSELSEVGNFLLQENLPEREGCDALIKSSSFKMEVWLDSDVA